MSCATAAGADDARARARPPDTGAARPGGTPRVAGRRLATALPAARSVVAVVAHPDDESFGLGAAISHYSAGGVPVAVACLTRGERSTLGEPDADLASVRTAELHAAGDALGVAELALFDHRDGGLRRVALGRLAADTRRVVDSAGADLLLVFDLTGITGHPDHRRATAAALEAAGQLPVLAWTLRRRVAERLRAETGIGFAGRDDEELDVTVRLDRRRQRQAIACHASQAAGNVALRRRLELQGDEEVFVWLRPPAPRAASAAGEGA